jgi:Na+-transporting NADH:ubiquinone oxidoreductase subunit A
VEPVVFEGPHPAGLPGTHIHFLEPVHHEKSVWYINYQDVAAIGYFFTHGKIDTQRIISLAGPMVKRPRLLRTRLGASIPELTENELPEGAIRLISGNVLRGRKVEEGLCHLGRYDLQITAIEEPREGELFGWISPGFKKHSLTRTVISAFEPLKKFSMNAAIYGGHRAIYPVDQFERVMPLEILPVFLFRALEVGDVEQAEALGCLELDEEDLALCTYADPGKNDYGVTLRNMLTTIEREG